MKKMYKVYLLFISVILLSHPAVAAMSGGGGGNSSSSSYSSDSSSSSGSYGTKKNKKKKAFDPFDHVYGLIRLEKFAEAHQSLKLLNVPTPSKHADKLNLLGFTARKSGDLSSAAKYYSEALKINPKHLQALEYQGELYLQLGEIDNAKQNLEKIKQICWLVCKEKKMLQKAIDVALNQ